MNNNSDPEGSNLMVKWVVVEAFESQGDSDVSLGIPTSQVMVSLLPGTHRRLLHVEIY